ncbi:MAG: DUF2069 domain-containing protein [Cytophagales bacterium]|nr:DUF2069 domain-containing protein [Cytophagales bacterium]
MKKLPLILLLALMTLCLLWETWLAPLRMSPSGVPSSAWLALKIIPLALAVKGFAKDRLYTYKWMSLAVWLYFIEGTVRGWSDKGLSSQLAWGEAALCVLLFVALVLRIRHIRPAAIAKL